MVSSIGKREPPAPTHPFFQEISNIMRTSGWKIVLNPIRVLLCSQSWPDYVFCFCPYCRHLQYYINPCWLSSSPFTETLHCVAQQDTNFYDFCFVLFRNDTKEDVFVHQVCFSFFISTFKKIYRYIHIYSQLHKVLIQALYFFRRPLRRTTRGNISAVWEMEKLWNLT